MVNNSRNMHKVVHRYEPARFVIIISTLFWHSYCEHASLYFVGKMREIQCELFKCGFNQEGHQTTVSLCQRSSVIGTVEPLNDADWDARYCIRVWFNELVNMVFGGSVFQDLTWNMEVPGNNPVLRMWSEVLIICDWKHHKLAVLYCPLFIEFEPLGWMSHPSNHLMLPNPHLSVIWSFGYVNTIFEFRILLICHYDSGACVSSWYIIPEIQVDQ